MSDVHDRVLGAATDVLDIEHVAPGMTRVTTLSDSYRVDVRHERCECPDWEYHLDGDGRCKHLWAALDATDSVGIGLGHTLGGATPSAPVATDGGQEQWTVRGEKPNGEVVEQTAESRANAEQMRDNAEDVGLTNVEVVPPGGEEPATDGGAQTPEVVDAESVDAETVETPDSDDVPDTLSERSVADDPLTWMPGEFVDDIDGTQAINRKGFEVLGHFYDVEVSAELQVPPEETDHEYCRVKATAVTPDGREVEAFGSAHVDRDDDPWLLLEMAGTRARKRALSVATGAGAVAVEELKNEVDHA